MRCSPENVYTGALKKDFLGFTLRGINEFITEEMKKMVDDFVNPPEIETEPEPEPETETETKLKKEFTEDERDAYYIIKGFLSKIIDPSRIYYRDTESYCNILLDDNNRKKIARLYFNNPEKKKIVIFSKDADEEKYETFSINNLNEIYNYSDKFKAIVLHYNQLQEI